MNFTLLVFLVILGHMVCFSGSANIIDGVPTMTPDTDDPFDDFVKSFPDKDSNAVLNLDWSEQNGTEIEPSIAPAEDDPFSAFDNSIVEGGVRTAIQYPTVSIFIAFTRTFPEKDAVAIFYVNGRQLASVSEKVPYRYIKIRVTKGDVIGVLANGTKGQDGVAMVIKIGRKFYSTGGKGFKASASFDSNDWKLRSYNACQWKPARSLTSAAGPNVKNAPFIWAPQAPEGTDVFIRFVIGGEDCSAAPSFSIRPTPRDAPRPSNVLIPSGMPRPSNIPRPSTFPRSSKTPRPNSSTLPNSSMHPNGSMRPSRSLRPRISNHPALSVESTEVPREPCNCVQVSDATEGRCFEFLQQSLKGRVNSVGRCKKRKCYPKYECVENGEAFTTRCMYKFATTETVSIRRISNNVHLCRTRLLRSKMFLVPYE